MTTLQAPLMQVSLTPEAHQTARQYAAEQQNPTKGKQVYLNTLAVYAVHYYLQWLQIASDLGQSDAWNPQLRALLNVADLVIPDMGKLECCPVLPGQTTVVLPAEAMFDRLGYIAIQFSEVLDHVELLGFAPPLGEDNLGELHLEEFQPLENLFDYLTPQSVSQPISPISEPVVLETSTPDRWLDITRWLQGEFQSGWQQIEQLINPPQLAYNWRSRTLDPIPADIAADVRGGKLLTMQLGLRTEQLILQISEARQGDQRFKVLVRLRRLDPSDPLPPQLQLSIYSEEGALQQEPVISAEQYNIIQSKPFTIPRGERFRVKVTHQGAILDEEFLMV